MPLTITDSTNSAANAGRIIGIVGAMPSVVPVVGILIGIPLGMAVVFSGLGMAH